MTHFQLVLPNGEARPVPPGGLRIGRGAGNDVVLGTAGVSRQHARVWLEGGQTFICDEGSTNGTYVNGVRLTPGLPHMLQPGDTVRIETVTLSVSTTGGLAPTPPTLGRPGVEGISTAPQNILSSAYTPHTAYPDAADGSATAPHSSFGYEYSADTAGGTPTGSAPPGPRRGILIAALAVLAVLLLAAAAAGAAWLYNKVSRQGVAVVTSTPPVVVSPTPTGTPTPTGSPTAPAETATALAGLTSGTPLPGGTGGVPAPGEAGGAPASGGASGSPPASGGAGGGTPAVGLSGLGGTPPALPVPTVAANLYPAPQLLAPPNGSHFRGPDAVIVLKWTSVGPLAANDYYIVTLSCPLGLAGRGKPLAARDSSLPTLQPLPTISWPPRIPPIVLPTMIPLPTGLPTFTLPLDWPSLPGVPLPAWTKDTQWRVPPELYSRLAGNRQCTWQVVVGGFGQTTSSGQLAGIGVSPPSPAWTFVWEK